MQSKFALLQGIMKTIYILGNGFDLAHGLKTSYLDFKSYLKKYHEDFLVKLEDLYGLQESIECCDPYINNDHKNSLAREISTNELEKISDTSLINPVVFARNCTPSSEKAILDIMIDASEHPLLHLTRGMILSPIFPVERDKIVYDRHDIDKMLLEYVDELKHKKGYKLLNQLESKIYVSAIHDRYKMYTGSALSMFIKEEDLYNAVLMDTKIELLPYSKKISIAFVTQLFPVLEIKIRELATLFGIFPFKKNIDEFMQYNDPSSLLRELLTLIFDEQHSFENVPDLVFIYNIMDRMRTSVIEAKLYAPKDLPKDIELMYNFMHMDFLSYLNFQDSKLSNDYDKEDFRLRTIINKMKDIEEKIVLDLDLHC